MGKDDLKRVSVSPAHPQSPFLWPNCGLSNFRTETRLRYANSRLLKGTKIYGQSELARCIHVARLEHPEQRLGTQEFLGEGNHDEEEEEREFFPSLKLQYQDVTLK